MSAEANRIAPDGGLAETFGRVIDTALKDPNGSFRDLAEAAGLDPATDFIGVSLIDVDFRDEDLRGFNFAKADLTGADFRRANVESVSFDGAVLVGVIGLPVGHMLGALPAKPLDPIARAQETARALLRDFSDEEFAVFARRGDSHYWLSFDAETHSRHARLMREAEARGAPLSIEKRVDVARAMTEITLYTADHPGLAAAANSREQRRIPYRCEMQSKLSEIALDQRDAFRRERVFERLAIFDLFGINDDVQRLALTRPDEISLDIKPG